MGLTSHVFVGRNLRGAGGHLSGSVLLREGGVEGKSGSESCAGMTDGRRTLSLQLRFPICRRQAARQDALHNPKLTDIPLYCTMCASLGTPLAFSPESCADKMFNFTPNILSRVFCCCRRRG